MVDGGLVCAGQDPAVTQERAETGDMEENNKGGGTITPSKNTF